MSSQEHLTKIHRLASQLLLCLPKELETPLHKLAPQKHEPLVLDAPHRELLMADLATYSISAECSQKLILMYEDKLCQLRQVYTEKHREACSKLHLTCDRDEDFALGFRQSLKKLFAIESQKIWQVVIQHVQERCNLIAAIDDHDPCLTSSTSNISSDTPSRGGRGHNTDAVRILEQAFQHTPNITQAEKYRLAEVTGLQPKQVTIWFQNRRNRKSKNQPVRAPTTPPSTYSSPLSSPSSPDSSAFANQSGNKKRKSYGSISLSSNPNYPSTPSSGLDDHSLFKKARVPRSTSDTSDSSVSSFGLNSSFTHWSSPSSRSTSSSSTSSSASDFFDSPSKAQNVFRWTKPSRSEGMSMPSVTVPPAANTQLSGEVQRSLFTCDNVSGATGPFNFSHLQFGMEKLTADLRESVHKAIELHSASQGGSRNVSWEGKQEAMDDDAEWVDEDESSTIPIIHSLLPINAPVVGSGQNQTNIPPFGAGLSSFAPPQPTVSWPPHPSQLSSCDTGHNASPSNASETESFNISQFLANASQASSQNSCRFTSQPLFQQGQPNPSYPMQQPQSAEPPQEANEIEMDIDLADLAGFQELYDLFASSQNSTDGEGSMIGGGQGGQGFPQLRLNFDQTPNMFTLA